MLSQVDHPDRRKCKLSQTKKKKKEPQPTGKMMFINQECFLTNAQRTQDVKGGTAACTGLCRPQLWLQIRRKTTATLKTLREMPPPPFIFFLRHPTCLFISSRHSIYFKRTSVTPRSRHPTWKLCCCRKAPPGRYSLDTVAGK